MATNDATSKYYSGQGVVMIAERDPTTGKPMGFVPVGNCSMLKINVATSVIEHKESQSGQRSIDLRLTTETKATLSMTLENFSKENLALALRGTATASAGATKTNETGYAGYFGKVSSLNYAKVSAVAVKAGGVALTAYTNATTPWDYKLNADAGSFSINDPSVTGVLLGVLGTNGNLTATGGAVGATTSIVATHALVGGERVALGGFTGTHAADLNGKVATVLTVTGTTSFTVDIDTTARTITFTTGKVYVEGAALTATYTYAAQESVDALTEGASNRYLRFEGLNTADTNKSVVVEVFKFVTDPLKELSLIGDTIGQITLDGNVLSDTLRATGSKFFKQIVVV